MMDLDAIIEDKAHYPTNKGLRHYLGNAISGLKNIYNNNLAVKFQLLYESAAFFSDKILTYFGLEYTQGSEGNPILSKSFSYMGIMPSAIGSYLALNMLVYFLSSKSHDFLKLTNKQLLGGLYVAIGGEESLVSLHNYLSINNYNDVIAKMTYTQFILPTAIFCAFPFAYYWAKNYLQSKKAKK